MTTHDIANRYYQLATQGQWAAIREELHDENIICQEPEKVAAWGQAVTILGREAIKAKSEANDAMIETIHSQYCGQPIVAGSFFSLVLKRDVTFKNKPRMAKEEVCVFEVKDGKIISERFFF